MDIETKKRYRDLSVKNLIESGLFRLSELEAWAQVRDFQKTFRVAFAARLFEQSIPDMVPASGIANIFSQLEVPDDYAVKQACLELEQAGFTVSPFSIPDPVSELRAQRKIQYARLIGYAVADSELPIYNPDTAIRMEIPALSEPESAASGNERHAAELRKLDLYTIDSAADELANKTGWKRSRWTRTIIDHVLTGQISLRNPQDWTDPLPYTIPKGGPREDYDLVTMASVNSWLDKHPEWGNQRLSVEAESSLEMTTIDSQETGLKRREKQIRHIENVADSLKYQRMKIARGGKMAIQKECLKSDLFTANSFSDAWKEAVAQGRIRTEQHEVYAHRE